MSGEDVNARISVIETEIDNLKRNHDMLENGMENLRKEQQDMRSEISQKFDALKEQVSGITMGALNSLPEWAARQFGNNHKLIGALISLLGVSVMVLMWVLFKGHGG